MEQIFTAEEKEKLLNYIPTFTLGYQTFPQFDIWDRSISGLRKNWINSRSPGEIKLMEFCENIIDDLIIQYPVLISDYPCWMRCLKLVDLDKNPTYIKRTYFIADGYSPKYNIIIEADYDGTHDIRYDLARDQYVWRSSSIFTYRFSGYGWNNTRDAEIQTKLKNIVSSIVPKPPITLDYSDYIILQYLKRLHKDLYNLLVNVSLGYPPSGDRNLLRIYYELCNIIGRKS